MVVIYFHFYFHFLFLFFFFYFLFQNSSEVGRSRENEFRTCLRVWCIFSTNRQIFVNLKGDVSICTTSVLLRSAAPRARATPLAAFDGFSENAELPDAANFADSPWRRLKGPFGSSPEYPLSSIPNVLSSPCSPRLHTKIHKRSVTLPAGELSTDNLFIAWIIAFDDSILSFRLLVPYFVSFFWSCTKFRVSFSFFSFLPEKKDKGWLSLQSYRRCRKGKKKKE